MLPTKFECPIFPKIKKHKNIDVEATGRLMILFIFKKNKKQKIKNKKIIKPTRLYSVLISRNSLNLLISKIFK